MNDGLKFKGYKSFKEDYVCIHKFEKINVFIGRNNSGKSSCLDIVENIIDPDVLGENKFLRNGLEIRLIHSLCEDDIANVFPKDVYGGGIPGRYHYDYGIKYLGSCMEFIVDVKNLGYGRTGKEFKYTYCENKDSFDERYNGYWKRFSDCKVNIWSQYKYRRIDAERNIVPEVESDVVNVTPNGNGASNLIRKIINHSDYDENLVQREVLAALNQIMFPDAKFDAIKIQQVDSNDVVKWEVFLQEGENRYALSKMGSGLKTILLVLLNLIVIPELKEYKDKKIVYAFEELENNLHPALQRRLFDFLYMFSNNRDVIVLLTTHSHIAINTYCDKGNTQIFHVEKENDVSRVHKVDDYIAKTTLLNDLDVRASDLLQSNGLIWVEGPSDRVYIKRWLEIFGTNDIEEGRDYQFLYYGGRLLSHYTVEQEQEYDNLVNILLTNRNAAIVIDSDKRARSTPINDTKKRIVREFEKYNAFHWVTQGKEIENYLPKEAIQDAYGKELCSQCKIYELFPNYIESVIPRFGGMKVEVANKLVPFITFENSSEILDLRKQIEALYATIKKWNSK